MGVSKECPPPSLSFVLHFFLSPISPHSHVITSEVRKSRYTGYISLSTLLSLLSSIAYLTFVQTPVTTYRDFSKQSIYHSAYTDLFRLSNDLAPEFHRFSIPPPISPFTYDHMSFNSINSRAFHALQIKALPLQGRLA